MEKMKKIVVKQKEENINQINNEDNIKKLMEIANYNNENFKISYGEGIEASQKLSNLVKFLIINQKGMKFTETGKLMSAIKLIELIQLGKINREFMLENKRGHLHKVIKNLKKKQGDALMDLEVFAKIKAARIQRIRSANQATKVYNIIVKENNEETLLRDYDEIRSLQYGIERKRKVKKLLEKRTKKEKKYQRRQIAWYRKNNNEQVNVHISMCVTNNTIKRFKLPKKMSITTRAEKEATERLRTKILRKKKKKYKLKKNKHKIRSSIGGILRLNAKKKNLFITVSDRATNKVKTAFTTRMIYKTRFGIAAFQQSDIRFGKTTVALPVTDIDEKKKVHQKMNVLTKTKKFLSKVIIQLCWHLSHTYNLKILDVEIQSNSKKKVRKALSLLRIKSEGRSYFRGVIRSITYVKRKIHGQMRPKKARRL